MDKIIKIWNKPTLIVKILIGIVLGAIMGILFPQASFIEILGTLFVSALKAVAPILIFFLIIASLCNASFADKRKFATVIFLYMFSTLLAAIAAVFAAKLFPIKLTFLENTEVLSAPAGISEVFKNLLANIVVNPVSALANSNYLAILFWGVCIGLAIKTVEANTSLPKSMQHLSDSIAKIVHGVIGFAPFGIMGIVFGTISTNGLSSFKNYGKLCILLVVSMLFTSLVINPILVAICLKKNPYPLIFKCLKESGITAFFTRSSAANIPVNMQLCERLGLDKELYSVSLPLGATINMDGAATTITIMSLCAAHSLGIAVDLPTAILLSIISTLGACGASGVAGGSLLLIPMACSLLGIPQEQSMSVVAIGFIISVIQDSVETALNSSGDVIFAATAEFMHWKKQGKELPF